MALGQLADAAGGRVVGDAATRITGLTYDSRQVRPGVLFAALRGSDMDGHRFIDNAIERGAAAIMIEGGPVPSTPTVIVDDCRRALARSAAEFFGHPSLHVPVIGVTGTDGKTTTSYLVKAILEASGYLTGMVGTTGVRIGAEVVGSDARQTTPESTDVHGYLRLMVDRGVDFAILEATSHGLAMHRLDEVVFRIGAVTNITHEHLEYHGSIDAYRRAKALLFERVAGAAGVAVINAEDAGAVAMFPFTEGCSGVITYGTRGGVADLQATEIRTELSGTHFTLAVGAERERFVKVPLLGTFNVENALCALSIALAAGVGIDAGVAALRTAPAVPGRMAIVDEGQPFAVVVDYAHTPASLAKVLTLLRSLTATGRLIVVFGSAGERDVDKRSLQGRVAARLADLSVFTNEDPRHEDPDRIIDQIATGARAAGGVEGTHFVRVPDRKEAIATAFNRADPGDCVLLAGKGHERSILIGHEIVPWDEQRVARDLLRRG